MDVYDKVANELLENLYLNLTEKVKNEIQNHQAQESKNRQAQDFYDKFKEFTQYSIDSLQKIQALHDVNISYKALLIYHANELEQATTEHEKHVEKSSLKNLRECKGKLEDVQNPFAYATHYNNRSSEFYKTGLAKDNVTKLLRLEIEKTHDKTENLKGNIPNKEFYRALNIFTKNFYKDYEKHQEKSRIYHKAKQEGIVDSFVKDSPKDFISKYPHLKYFGEAIKKAEEKLNTINLNEAKSAVNQINRKKILKEFIEKSVEEGK